MPSINTVVGTEHPLCNRLGPNCEPMTSSVNANAAELSDARLRDATTGGANGRTIKLETAPVTSSKMDAFLYTAGNPLETNCNVADETTWTVRTEPGGVHAPGCAGSSTADMRVTSSEKPEPVIVIVKAPLAGSIIDDVEAITGAAYVKDTLAVSD